MKHHGQSLLEVLLLLSAIAWLLSTGIVLLQQQLSMRHQQLDQARLDLWQLDTSTLSKSSDYAFANGIKPVLNVLTSAVAIKLPLDNLLYLPATEKHAAMARLSSSWSPANPTDLKQRPQSLTIAPQLTKLGLPWLLDKLAWFPFARELGGDSLALGYVAIDATPVEIDCLDHSRQCAHD